MSGKLRSNALPLLPLKEGRLNNMPLREKSIERVFAYHRWTHTLDEEPTPGGLVKCFRQNKQSTTKTTGAAHDRAAYAAQGVRLPDLQYAAALLVDYPHQGIGETA